MLVEMEPLGMRTLAQTAADAAEAIADVPPISADGDVGHDGIAAVLNEALASQQTAAGRCASEASQVRSYVTMVTLNTEAMDGGALTMAVLAGDGTGRGGWRWHLLGGDPTPGDLGSVEALIRVFGDAGERGTTAAEGVDAVVDGVAGASWQGPLAEAFTPAVGPLREEVGQLGLASQTVTDGLDGWRGVMELCQEQAGRLMQQADDAENRRQQAQFELEQFAIPQLRSAQRAATAASFSENPDDAAAAQAALAAAQTYHSGVLHRISEAEHELADLRVSAGRLADDYASQGDYYASAMGEGIMPASSRGDFGSGVALQIITTVLPLEDYDVNGDGQLSPTEMAAVLADAARDDMPVQDRMQIIEALGPILATTITDEDRIAELNEAVGPGGFEQIFTRILADIEDADPPHVNYNQDDVAIGSMKPLEGHVGGHILLQQGAMGLRLEYEGGGRTFTVEELADLASTIGTAAGWAALGLLGLAVVFGTGGAAVPVMVATAQVAGGVAAVSGGVELVAGGIVEGDPGHLVGGGVNVIGGIVGGTIPVEELDDVGRLAVLVHEMAYFGTAQSTSDIAEDNR